MENIPLARKIQLYPGNVIPSVQWLKELVLYWDCILVPRYTEVPPINVLQDASPRIMSEVDATFVRTSEAGMDYLASEGYLEFVSIDGTIADDGGALRASDAEFLPLYERIFSPGRYTEHSSSFHISKKILSESVADTLRQNGHLADNDSDFYLVPPGVFAVLSTIQVKQVSKQACVPYATEDASYENLMFPPGAGRAIEGLSVATTLKGILPVPRPDVGLADLVKFREKHTHELLNFHTAMGDMHKRLSECANPTDFHEALLTCRESILVALGDLRDTLRDANIEAWTTGLRTLTRINSPNSLPVLAVAAGAAKKMAELPLSWTVAGVLGMGLIEVACHAVDLGREQRRILRESPYSYLYKAFNLNS